MNRSLAVVAVVAIVVTGCQTSATPSPAATSNTSPPAATQAGSVPPSVAVVTPAPPSQTPAKAGHWVGVTADEEPVDNRIALGDGRVLNIRTSQVEEQPPTLVTQLWDPATDKNKDTPSLPSYREQFVGLTLADGRALVTGGLNDKRQSFSSTYIYDPKTESWTKSGLLGIARTAAAGAVLRDGRVLVMGGYFVNGPTSTTPGTVRLAAFHPGFADVDIPPYTNALATAEIFDPSSGTWSPTGPMVYARSEADAVTMADGRVLVFGSTAPGNGIEVDGNAQRTAEIFDPATGKFTLTGPLPPIDRAGLQAQGKKGANPVPEGESTWTTGHPVALRDGGAVIIGLSDSWKHEGDVSRSVRYDPSTNAWSEIGQTWVSVGEPTPNVLYIKGVPDLSGSASASLPDGRVLIAGGSGPTVETKQADGTPFYDNESTDAVQYYDPAANAWTAGPNLPQPQAGGRALTLADGSVLVYAGTVCTLDPDNYECVPATSERYVP
jgi:hypothetical protein